MIRLLYDNMKGHRLRVGVAILLTFVAVACDVLIAFPFKFILDKIVNHKDPAIPGLSAIIAFFDRFGDGSGLNPAELHSQLGVILFSGALLIMLGVIDALVSYVQLSLAVRVGYDLGARLRNRLFIHLGRVSLHWHGHQRVGEIVQRISGNITDIEKMVIDGVVDLLAGILTLAAVLAVMFVMNFQFTLLSMFVVPSLFLSIAFYTRWIKRASKETARAAGQVAEVATENIGAIAELKAFTLEGWAARIFASRVEKQRRFGLRAGRRQSEFSPLVTMLTVLSNAVIVTAGGWIASGHGHRLSMWLLTIPAGSLTIGSLTVFVAYSKLLYQPMRDLSKLMLLASTGAAAAQRIRQILEQPWEELPATREHTGGSVRGDVAFKGVVFGYQTGAPVLHDIDLDVRVGTRVALVGLSGSGKTTLVRLLPRFYDPWQGSITVDGLDVRDYPLDVLRRNIGLVLQDSVLFEGTIQENIVLDRQDVTQEEIVAAAAQACVHETIMKLPGGYDAQVREHGKNLSSGQRQRIAIARAFLRDAPILILDEPTANLDVEAETEVMRAIERLTAGRTVIVISHRLNTLGNVDEIVVLESGRIAERGTYQQLKARGGVFTHLLAAQNRYAAEPINLDTVDGRPCPPSPMRSA